MQVLEVLLKGFAGAKGGVEVGADLRWMRSSAKPMEQCFTRFARSLPGKLDDYLVDKLPKNYGLSYWWFLLVEDRGK